MARIPYARLELRLADSSRNPYLAQAAMIAAELGAIESELGPSDSLNLNFYGLSERKLGRRKINLIPQTVDETVNGLATDIFFKRLRRANCR